MAYQTGVALNVPLSFTSFYGRGYGKTYKTIVTAERVPHLKIHGPNSPIQELMWLASFSNIAENDKEHLERIIQLYSDLPFRIACTECGSEEAAVIALDFQEVNTGAWGRPGYSRKREFQYRTFPYYCSNCGHRAGTEHFPINFDEPLRRRDDAILHRNDIARDLKRLVVYAVMLDGLDSSFTVDPMEINSRVEQMQSEGKPVNLTTVNNRMAKRITNGLHHIREERDRRETSPQQNMFDPDPCPSEMLAAAHNEYRQRNIIYLTPRRRSEEQRDLVIS